MAEPEHQSADGGAGEVAAGEFVKASGDGPPLLELAETAFHQVALLIGLVVEGRRAPAPAAFALAVGELVLAFGDDRFNAATAQVGANLLGGIALVTEQSVRAGTGPAYAAA